MPGKVEAVKIQEKDFDFVEKYKLFSSIGTILHKLIDSVMVQSKPRWESQVEVRVQYVLDTKAFQS